MLKKIEKKWKKVLSYHIRRSKLFETGDVYLFLIFSPRGFIMFFLTFFFHSFILSYILSRHLPLRWYSSYYGDHCKRTPREHNIHELLKTVFLFFFLRILEKSISLFKLKSAGLLRSFYEGRISMPT